MIRIRESIAFSKGSDLAMDLWRTLYNAVVILNSAVAGLKMAHLLEITSAFEFAVLTLTVPGLRLHKYQNPLCFRVSAPFSSSLTAEFRIILAAWP